MVPPRRRSSASLSARGRPFHQAAQRIASPILDAFSLEVAAQRRLTLGLGARLQIVGHFLQHLYVGLDTLGPEWTGPDGVKYRAVVSRSAPLPEPSGIMVCTELLPNERVHHERCVARFLVLQGAGDDFGRRSGTAADQHDDRLGSLGQITRPGVEALDFLGVAGPRVETISPLSRNASDTEIA